MNDSGAPIQTAEPWLLLIHQLPAKPAYLRVKVWRRLQGIGAVAVKNAVHALPASSESREDFEWLRREIAEGGGEAMIVEARMVAGLDDAQVRALFDTARGADYAALRAQAEEVAATLDGDPSESARAEAKAAVQRLRARLGQIVPIDFFGAGGRDAAEDTLAAIEARLEAAPAPAGDPGALRALVGWVWVTRRDVHIDRIASAWLIRRFVDPDARLKFVPAKGYVPGAGELRFDMFEAEFTHEGDRCTFEVLVERLGVDDPALRAVAEIVHDIDLKDGKFGRPEADGIRTLIAGICTAPTDEGRIARGAAAFDDLYAFFQQEIRR
ncbi:MAG: chromate resistance protein ChrB domain-containing protein [Alphaproteobacteria bacterium]